MNIWKTKLSIGLLWMLAFPYILQGVYNLLYLTVWNKPGYQTGEQFALIWIIFAIIVIIILATITFALLRRKNIAYWVVLLGLVYNTVGNVVALLSDQSPGQILYTFIGITAIILLVLDWRSLFGKSKKIGAVNHATQLPVERKTFQMNTPVIIVVILILGAFGWYLQYRENVTHIPERSERLAEGVHTNELGLSRSNYLNFPFGIVGDIQPKGTQIIIAGETGATLGTSDEPLQQPINFANPFSGNRAREHKVAVIPDGKIRFYNNNVIRDETGKILGNINATPGFTVVRQIDTNSDGISDFFVVAESFSILSQGPFKKGVDIEGQIMGEDEYKQYYPMFLYDKIVEYPLGSGMKFYQRITAPNGMRQLELYKIDTKELAYTFPAGTTFGTDNAANTYTDMAAIHFGEETFAAELHTGPSLSTIHLYDKQGARIYYEVFKEHCEALLPTMVQNKPALLIGCTGIVYNLTR